LIGLYEQTIKGLKGNEEVLPIIVIMLTMVTSEERCAAIIALHQNSFTCKAIAAKNFAPARTI